MSKGDVAVKISRNVASSGYSWTDEVFYMDEVFGVQVPDNQQFVKQESQSRAPTILKLGSNYKTITITFLLARRGTLDKLKNLRDWTADGGRLLVYPKMQADDSVYYDCVLEPGSIPDQDIVKGWDKANSAVTVNFLEFQKNVAIAEEEA